MHELGVGADGNDFCARLFERFILLCQSSKFRGSDEGEIGGIKEKYRPLLCCFLGGEADFAEIALDRIERLQFEIRDSLPDAQTTTVFRHDDTSLKVKLGYLRSKFTKFPDFVKGYYLDNIDSEDLPGDASTLWIKP
jgi:hypothetical protein